VDATIISLPYAAGRPDVGMGLGPGRLLAAHPERLLGEHGHRVDVVEVRPAMAARLDEPEAVALLDHALAAVVADALDAERFPLVLAGNCNSSLGTIAGLQQSLGRRVAGVWCDAHGDLNVPGSAPDAFFDGMGLAIATGRARDDLARGIGLTPVPESHVLHLGSRDLDPPEAAYLGRGAMPWIAAAALQDDVAGSTPALAAALADLERRTDATYLHVDVDVLSEAFAPGVDFPCPGGLTLSELEDVLVQVVSTLSVRAAAITAYDPDRERDETTLRSALRLIVAIIDAIQARA